MRPHLVDTTLRDGVQAPGVVLARASMVEIAQALASAGVPELEVGVPAAGPEAVEDVRAVVRALGSEKVVTWARARDEDIHAAAACGAGAIHVSFPASPIHQRIWGWSRGHVLNELRRLAARARRHGTRVYVGAQDASRAEPAFLADFARTAQEAGVQRIRLADTTGILLPKTAAGLVALGRQAAPQVQWEFHGHNDLGLATANTLAAIEAGVDAVSVTVNGLGERAGNAALEEVVVALRVAVGVDCGIDLSALSQLSDRVSRASGVPISSQKPIVGSSAFRHESGLHCAGLLKDPRSYEPFAPDLVGRDRASFVLGAKTGSAAVRHVLAGAGVYIDAARARALAAAVRRHARAIERALATDEVLALHLKSRAA